MPIFLAHLHRGSGGPAQEGGYTTTALARPRRALPCLLEVHSRYAEPVEEEHAQRRAVELMALWPEAEERRHVLTEHQYVPEALEAALWD